MTNKKLREDEEFVIFALARAFSGSWSPGEDPPDAYLDITGRKIAVEISTLTQYVDDHKGNPMPRFSQDAAALRLCEELNKELYNHIQQGKTVHLTLESPINKVRQLKSQLGQKILELAKPAPTQPVECKILENKITIQVTAGRRPSDKKVVGIVINQRSNANILMNAQYILDDRIGVKDAKCQSLNFKGTIWLALFNDYWLADVDTYKQAIASSTVSHRFEEILLVSGSGAVASLYKKNITRSRL